MYMLMFQTRQKSLRYRHILVSVHKLTTNMFYSSIFIRLIVQMNYVTVYKSKSINTKKNSKILQYILKYRNYRNTKFPPNTQP